MLPFQCVKEIIKRAVLALQLCNFTVSEGLCPSSVAKQLIVECIAWHWDSPDVLWSFSCLLWSINLTELNCTIFCPVQWQKNGYICLPSAMSRCFCRRKNSRWWWNSVVYLPPWASSCSISKLGIRYIVGNGRPVGGRDRLICLTLGQVGYFEAT